MSLITLESQHYASLLQDLQEGKDVVACLCAAWCDVCGQYRPDFERLAARHPGTRFVWIDIEDQADTIGDIDVENFPTLLLQRGDIVAFFGTVLPDAHIAERLIQNLAAKSTPVLQAEAASSEERRNWQEESNLRRCLQEAMQD